MNPITARQTTLRIFLNYFLFFTVIFGLKKQLQAVLFFIQLSLSYLQEKTRLYEEERDKNQKERQDFRKKSGEEVEGMRKDLVKMANKLATMQDELRTKDEINGQLR